MPLRNEADRPRGRQSAKSSRPRTRSRRGTAAPRTRPPSRPAILNTQALAAPGIDWIRPLAFAARLSGPARPTGFPSTARRSHLYMCAFPDWEFVSAYAATQLHPQRTTSLRGYAPTGLHAAARSNGGRVARGRPRAMLQFFERGAVGASRKPSASAGLLPRSGGAAENPRPGTRDPVCIPADALRNRKKKGTGVRVRGNPCRIYVTQMTG